MSSSPGMTPERWHQVGALFAEAQERPRAERESWVARAAADDSALAADVASLLREADQLTGFLDTAASVRHVTEAAGAFERDTCVGAYRLLGILGRGGMGVVWLAEQSSPRRTVALKVMAVAAPSPAAVRRFQRESAVLARLQHPGIAQIYESGTAATPRGALPWFAMERVEGLPLTEFAAAHALDLSSRLTLFVQICDAVQHAHEKGVIHRDLKPANILVDRSGRAKVLDFGIARAIDADRSSATQRTEAGLLVGTLAYMSPEQVTGRELDPRSDVYALGVVLYELLTGRLPHDLDATSLPQAARILCEEDPVAPDVRNRALRGDLTTILVKALEREPTRRYASARALAEDIERFLANLPIRARTPTTAYQIAKFARRHKPLVLGMAAALAALIAGITATTVEAVRAEGHRATAERKADSARRMLELLKDMVSSIDPEFARDRDVSVLIDMLARAEERIGSSLEGEPEAEAELRGTLAKAYLSLGRPRDAERQSARRLEIAERQGDPLLAADARTRHAVILRYVGRPQDSEELLRASIASLGGVSPLPENLLSDSWSSLGETLYELAHGPTRDARAKERVQEARDAFRRALDLHRECDATRAETLLALGNAERDLGDLAAAEASMLESLDCLGRSPMKTERAAATVVYSLGLLAREHKQLDEAESRWRESLRLYRLAMGDAHPAVATNWMALAHVHEQRADWAQVEACSRAALAIRRSAQVDANDLADTLHVLARALEQQNRVSEAEPFFCEAVEAYRSALPEGHAWIGIALATHGHALLAMDRRDEARELLGEAVWILRASCRADDRHLTGAIAWLNEAEQ